MKKVFLFTTLILISFMSFSQTDRKPAVEQLNFFTKKIDSKYTSGYDFNSIAIESNIVERIKGYISPIMALGFMLLPVCFWLTSSISFKKQTKVQPIQIDNVESLSSYRNKNLSKESNQNHTSNKDNITPLKKVG